jgi:hypothetical protein
LDNTLLHPLTHLKLGLVVVVVLVGSRMILLSDNDPHLENVVTYGSSMNDCAKLDNDATQQEGPTVDRFIEHHQSTAFVEDPLEPFFHHWPDLLCWRQFSGIL